jgi:hypothetical protein
MDADTIQRVMALNPDVLTTPPSEREPGRAAALFKAIRAGRHPLTREGVVLTRTGERPTKIKFKGEHDVLIRRIFKALTKGGPARAGGFEYALPEQPEKTVGRVGTGFLRDTLVDMLEHPELYEGRTARVEAQEKFPSGALRAPVYLSTHEG